MTRYSASISNGGTITAEGGEALTNDQIRRFVPSVFAAEAHESRSERFAHVPTSMLLDGLRKEGFEPFFAQQAKSRIIDRREHTKHMVRLRNRSLTRTTGEAFEIILVNGSDGSAAVKMLGGFWRFVCSNGCAFGDTLATVHVRHTGAAIDQTIEGAYTLLDAAPKAMDHIQHLKSLALSGEERLALASSAHMLRFPDAHVEDPELRKPATVTPQALLQTRRYADAGNDLFTTAQVIQENMVRGGQTGLVLNPETRRMRRATTRPVTGIDGNVNMNRALANLVDMMAALKTA